MSAVAPQRIQRKRSKGWRMPANAVYVGRPTKWGNPFAPDGQWTGEAIRQCVGAFRSWMTGEPFNGRVFGEKLRRPPTDIGVLRGKDLACWCPIGQACHADVLLELANAEDGR